MKKPLRVLVIEDSEFDAQILLAFLRKGGYDPIFERIQTAQEMRAALDHKSWDVILADYNLPQFSAPDALKILHETGLDVPFIIISGAVGENTAVEVMRSGANDYLMKGNLTRLIPAVERELREAANRVGRKQTREALRQSELRYRLLWETATDAIVLMDTRMTIQFANPAVREVFGFEPEELIGKSLSVLQPARLREACHQGIERYLETGAKKLNWRGMETIGLRKDGKEIPVEVAFSDMELSGQRWFVGFIRDVSERKRTEQTLLENQEQFRIAREIQQHLFPKNPPALPGFDIAGASRPADATGGDYFDYLPMLQNRLGVVVGDVTGHGIGPALLMAETRAYLRILAKNRDDLGEILTHANSVLAEDVGYERFITLLLARIDPSTRTLIYANAGHPPGYVFGPDGQVKFLLKRTGIPLGLKPDSIFAASDPIHLSPDDIILLLTDGFEEATSSDDRVFGIEKTLQIVREHRREPAEKIVQALYSDLMKFTRNTPQADDLTVLVVKVRPAPPAHDAVAEI